MSYNDQLRKIADEYFNTFGAGGTAKEILRWAYETGKWAPHPDDFIRAGAEQLARAMRDDSRKDPQGRTVRTKHVILVDRDGEQSPIWHDYRNMTPEQMELSFQYRRRQIVSDCVQLKNDVDSYNENLNPGFPIQIIFDFTDDTEEENLLRRSTQRKTPVTV
jgi:hypothetical protein